MRDIKRIFVHCTAGSQKLTKNDLLREFKSKGWSKPGYHYVVFPDGKVEQLLPESEVSNGVQGYNSTSINISYVGGIDSKGRAVDNRTDAQKAALLKTLKALKLRYPNAHIMGHRDIWGKDSKKWRKMCPCFDAEKEYEDILSTKEMGKYEDATGTTDTGALDDGTYDETAPKAQPEIYVYNHITDYTGNLSKYAPWAKQ